MRRAGIGVFAAIHAGLAIGLAAAVQHRRLRDCFDDNGNNRISDEMTDDTTSGMVRGPVAMIFAGLFVPSLWRLRR